jgi:nucleotide-binding universal stress UspA family protein
MFSRIMTPVDLAHVARLGKALSVSSDMAKHFGIPVTYVGVTAATPGALGHNPEEFGRKLAAFGEEQARTHGIEADTRVVVSHDPTTDVDDALLKAVSETGSDLVVMASHIPGLVDYIWPSNGGKLAAHSSASVFVVRG